MTDRTKDPSGQQRPAYCKCAFTDPDGTFVPGEACAIHPDVKPQREALTSNQSLIADVLAFLKTQQSAEEICRAMLQKWPGGAQYAGSEAEKAFNERVRLIARIESLPVETSGPFERTAILADPNTMRIKIAFQEREDYEAALVFFQMGDSPKEPRETTENPNNAPARDLLIVSTGPWNENRFTVCRGTTEVEDDIIADFVHRADAELFVAAKRSAEEPTELPEALRDPVKNLERGRELLKAWGPTPVTDAALAESKESPLARAVRIARGDTGPPTEPVRFAEKARELHAPDCQARLTHELGFKTLSPCTCGAENGKGD